MDIIKILIFFIYVALSHFVAQYIGAKRKIGYGKSVFWSILFTPVVGLVVTLLSKPINK